MASVSPFYLLAPLEDSLLPSMSWLSQPGCAGTSCLPWLLSLLCDELARFAPLAGLGLISVYQLCVKGISSSIPGNTTCSSRLLWPMVFFCCFEQLDNVLHHQHNSPLWLLLVKLQFLAQSPLSLLLAMVRVFGPRNLFHLSLIYRIKWMAVMAQCTLCLSATVFN